MESDNLPLILHHRDLVHDSTYVLIPEDKEMPTKRSMVAQLENLQHKLDNRDSALVYGVSYTLYDFDRNNLSRAHINAHMLAESNVHRLWKPCCIITRPNTQTCILWVRSLWSRTRTRRLSMENSMDYWQGAISQSFVKSRAT
jgi:hypothetical protein